MVNTRRKLLAPLFPSIDRKFNAMTDDEIIGNFSSGATFFPCVGFLDGMDDRNGMGIGYGMDSHRDLIDGLMGRGHDGLELYRA
jgi:hypothetical protein